MAAQASLCLAWSETPEDKFCHVVAQINCLIGRITFTWVTAWQNQQNDVRPAKTPWMPRLIWVFIEHTGHFVGFVVWQHTISQPTLFPVMTLLFMHLLCLNVICIINVQLQYEQGAHVSSYDISVWMTSDRIYKQMVWCRCGLVSGYPTWLGMGSFSHIPYIVASWVSLASLQSLCLKCTKNNYQQANSVNLCPLHYNVFSDMK